MNYVQKINMRRVSAYVLRHFWQLCASGILLAVIYAGYAYRTITAGFITQEEYEEQQQNYQEQLTQYENTKNSLLEQIQALEDLAADREDYDEHSVYLQIDGYHEWVASCMLYAAANPGDVGTGRPAGNPSLFIRAVSDLPETYDLLADLAAATGAKSYEYVHDLIEIVADDDAASITVKAVGPDEKTAKALLDATLLHIRKTAEALRDTANCSVSVLYETAFTHIDNDVMEAQNASSTSISNLKNTIAARKADFDKLSQPKPPEAALYSAKVVWTGIGRKLPLGFLGGVLLSGIIYALVYIFAMKLREPEELTLYYNIRMLGVIDFEYAMNHSSNPLSSLYQRLVRLVEGKNLRRSFDDVMDFTFAVIDHNREMGNIQSVCVLSSRTDGQESARIAPYLQEHYQPENLSFELVNYTQNPSAAIRSLSRADAFLLLEQLDKTSFRDVCKMASELQTLKKPVIGAIYF